MSTNRFSGDCGRRLTAAVAAVLIAGGAGVLVVAAHGQRTPPQPPVSAPSSPTAPSTPTPSPTDFSPTPSPTTSKGLSRSAPVSISIPAVKVTSVVRQLGLDSHGSIAVPAPGPHYDDAAWFTGSPAPGQVGPATILGHIDSAKNGPSVFFKLGALKSGDKVKVARADGKAVTFEVYKAQRYHKDAFPTLAVYGNTKGPELRLITCGGSFDSGTGRYVDNIVVYARAIGLG